MPVVPSRCAPRKVIRSFLKQSGWVGPSLVLLLLGSGCIHYRLGSAPRPPLALPEAFAVECRLPGTNAPTVLDWQDESPADYPLAHVKLAAPMAGTTTNKTLELEYYRPRRSGTVPAIMILPVSAGAHYPLERHFARYFALRGFAAVIVHRETERDPSTGEQINGLLQQSVRDNALVIDWLESRPEIDGRRIGVLGTSMGAIKGALFVAVDARVKAAVLGLVGGDLPYLLSYTTEGAWRGGGIVRRRQAYLAEHHLTREQFREELEKTIRYDPNLLAPCVDPKKVLLILGACDTIVPFKKGWELRRAMGKPETAVVLSGHYSALFYLWYIRATALDFFQRKMVVGD